MMNMDPVIAAAVAVCMGLAAVLIPISFRKVVETNKVHIVQSRKRTTSYGTGQADGNVYYCWPSWLPVLGVTRIVLPVNNFELHLNGYDAYDKDRLPFSLDVVSFFRIQDTNKAAERVSDFDELKGQLQAVLQGAIRKILSSYDIHQVMTDRATFGDHFTREVSTELANWGVAPVKSVELMDIRDSRESRVIANIMAMKASHIEMESRVAVAKNQQASTTAEIEAKRQIAITQQAAEEDVGKRTLTKEQALRIATQKMEQGVAEEEVATTTKQMVVQREAAVRKAEMEREAAVVAAQQAKEVAVLEAEAMLEATRKRAEGTKLEGQAKADAEQAMQMAPVNAQIQLAKEIGGNDGYQRYLVSLETVKAQMTVGTAQAEALQAAQIKIIANTGSVIEGVASVGELFSPKGGLALGAALEALNNTPQGARVIKAIAGANGEAPSA